MNTKSRTSTILNTQCLDPSVTGLPSFNLSSLNLSSAPNFELPTNLRLGHLAERIVAALINASTNYNLLHENVQVTEHKKTIGEIDFIIEKVSTQQVTHLELAYKFYLFDPSISAEPINNWIGPNRNDSLVEKLEKIKSRQFPLLYHDCTKALLPNLEISQVAQALCLLVSLFVPYGYQTRMDPRFEKAVKGYYVNMETFRGFDHSGKSYFMPTKTEWGMDPADNDTWMDFQEAEKMTNASIKEKQAPLCWQKLEEAYSVFFIVWW